MPELHFLNGLDYAVLGAFMLIVVAIGFYVSRFNRVTDDYFKGGGRVPWRLAGVSLFISGFSAFMFVGASGIAYGSGGGAMILFTLALPAYLLGYFLYGPLWRRTRIDTPLQFLTRRFSQGTTYFYTLMAVVPNTLILGIMIYTLCIFISTALGIGNLSYTIGPFTLNGFEMTLLVTGSVIMIYTTLGGLWAVMVTDAVQFLIVLLVTLVMTPMAFALLGDGNVIDGIGRLFSEAPEGYFKPGLSDRPTMFWPVYFIYLIFGYNVNWHIAQRYYSVADERDTKKMALWCGIFSFVLPALWILPVLTTPILFPNIEALWPDLAQPSEASFVTLALAVLPHGMLGLLAAAIFSATMSSSDTMFNWLSAVLTKDVYVPISKAIKGREPAERLQLIVGKTIVAVLGVIAIWVAFSVQRFGGAFEVYLRAESLYKIALFVPVLFGLWFTKTPWWSAIASVGIGMFAIFIVGILATIQSELPMRFMNILFADYNVAWFGYDLTRYEVNALTGLIVASVVFWASAFLNKREGEFKERIEAYEKDIRTPAYADEEVKVSPDGLKVYRLVAKISIGIGVALIAISVFTLDRVGWLNAIVGIIAIAIGVTILKGLQRYCRKHGYIEG